MSGRINEALCNVTNEAAEKSGEYYQSEIDRLKAVIAKLRECLKHQAMRNHDYLPSGCSPCTEARAILESK